VTGTPAPADAQGDNTVWATVEVPAPPGEVLALCTDVVRLLHLNPYLDIRACEEAPGPFAPGKRFRLHALNEMTGIERDLILSLETVSDDGFSLAYSEGLKRALEVCVAPHGAGCALTLREHYRPADPPDDAAQLAEVDRSVMPWGVSVRRYVIGVRRWGRLAPYRWARRFWLGMRPRERRIARLVTWITALEFVVFLFVFAIFWIERHR
jgi:hypothetical protein